MRIEHLYIHVPFCVRRCAYCDFAVTTTREAPADAWLDAIGAELDGFLASGHDFHLRTLYIGGGTPSLLPRGAMSELARRLRDRGCVWDRNEIEWTAEANPESFSSELADDWTAAGVNRVSFGVQSFDDRVLRWMGRLHGSDGPGRAVEAARSAGICNISVDLIFGLPERLGRDWRADLDRTIALNAEHVSLYGLTAETGTPLGRRVSEGRESLASETTYEEEYLFAAETLPRAGYEHYEVSNFARSGSESRHNQCYWKGFPYVGLGPGAHSYMPPWRHWNTRSWVEYAQALADDRSPVTGSEEVTGADARLEQVWLGLRTTDGAPVEGQRQNELARLWRERGWGETVSADGRLRLSARGWLLLDRLAVEFSGSKERETTHDEAWRKTD